jgi:O-antigen/teichoic acid export membrane protein
MQSGQRQDLLSIGVFLVIIIIGIILYTPLGIITDWTLIVPLIIALSGCWIIALAGIRSRNPQKYQRGAFSTLSWGLLIAALGGAWFIYGYGWVYSLILVLLVVAVVAIAAAMKRK